MTYELNESYQPIRKYMTGFGMDDYEGHLDYSEITDWYHIFLPNYNQPWYSYMKDQVGTIYKVHSLKTRSVVESRTYDTFGNLVNQTGTTQTLLGFQGKYYDAESGLNYFYHRYYNPTIGRFTSEDPIGILGGINYFNFESNNPVQFLDPTGLDWTDNYKEQYRKISEDAHTLRIELKRILRENQVDINESQKYCPKWSECFQECFHVVINTDIEVAMHVFKWVGLIIPSKVLLHFGIIKASTAHFMHMGSHMILLGGAISNVGAAIYCAAQCTQNPRSF